MKVAGVIAEYNPFHNGHQYQLEQLRRETGADYIVIAMSGNFLQRGVPAITDKYLRTKMALLGGADLVLELPSVWSTASAQYFASAGVALLAKCGVVDTICFGVETKQPDQLYKIADFLYTEPPEYLLALKEQLKTGKSFAAARIHALRDCTSLSENLNDLSMPNNILALEYLCAIRKQNSLRKKSLPASDKRIAPPALSAHMILRRGDNYHDSTVSSRFASATAIRKLLLSSADEQPLSSVLPANTHALLNHQKCLIPEDAISQMLYYKLLSEQHLGYCAYADCNEELSHRIRNKLPSYQSFTQFCSLLKCKDFTYTRISRVLVHILLNIKASDYALGKELGMIPYLRVLGFRKNAGELLHSIKKQSSVPLITKMADAFSIIPTEAAWMLQKDIFAADIYQHLLPSKEPPKNEFNRGILIL